MVKEIVQYVIADKGHIITTPMSLEDLKAAFGPINKLERGGLRVIKVGKIVVHNEVK